MGSASAGTSGGAAAAGDRRDPHRCLWHDPPTRHRGARQQQHRRPAPRLRTAPLRRAAPGTLRRWRNARPARAHPATAAGTGQGPRNVARRHGLTHLHDVRGLQAAARRPGQEPRRLPATATGRSRRTWRDRALPTEEHPPRRSDSTPGRHRRSESVRLNCPALFSRTARFALWS